MLAVKPTELSRIKLKNLNSTARPYDQWAFSPLDPTVSWLSHLALTIYIFVVVNFDALAQASDIQIERRQVVFLCWMQDLNPGSQTLHTYIHTYTHTHTHTHIYIHIYIYVYIYITRRRFVKMILWGFCLIDHIHSINNIPRIPNDLAWTEDKPCSKAFQFKARNDWSIFQNPSMICLAGPKC